jgi:hypothetical protein
MLSLANTIFKDALAALGCCIGRWPLGNRTVADWAPRVVASLKELGPYALIELLLPGGSLLALTIWLYRRRKKIQVVAGSC